ncbi:hypothetical protein JL721_6875 [Aureococcus anophagefferens]|nr:hypothetical protein JL721_6875 [Aureococcus anophagefferens]
MRRARRSTSVYEVAKKCAVVRAEAAMDSPVRCELGRGAAVMMSKRVTVMTADGKSVDRCLLTRPVEGWTSFVSIPKARPTLFVYSRMDSVILPEHVEEYVATYDAADVSTLEFATVPHIGGMRVRKDEYNRSVDPLLARAFPASDGSDAITAR